MRRAACGDCASFFAFLLSHHSHARYVIAALNTKLAQTFVSSKASGGHSGEITSLEISNPYTTTY